MSEEKKPKSSNRIFFIAIIAILLIANGLLWFNNNQISKEQETTQLELESVEALKAELEMEVDNLDKQLMEYQGLNAEMDSMLQEKIAELKNAKAKIEKLLRKDKITSSELSKARTQIEELKVQTQVFIAQIDSLQNVNQKLSVENETLEQRLDIEKEFTKQLQTEKDKLSEKVALGSLLKTQDIISSGVRYRNNGKEVTTNRAKKAEKIKVCFDVLENKVAEKGDKQIFMRIIEPGGSSIHVESHGSGTFVHAESGETRQYTTQGILNYENERKRVCMYWTQDMEFGDGLYTVELYQEGHQIGTAVFDMK